MQIGIASIYIDNSLDIRDKINLDAVDTYAEIFDKLPDITVFDVEKNDEIPEGFYYLADGLHRLEAAKKLQKTEIGADIKKGTLKEAKAYALKANLAHGIPLTRSERARATKRMIMLYPERSDSWLAEEMGVSDKTVRRYREELESGSEIPTLNKLIGKDGKEYPRSIKQPKTAETPEREAEPQSPGGTLTNFPEETTSKPQEASVTEAEELESVGEIPQGQDGKERPREVPHPKRDKSADETPEREAELQEEATPQADTQKAEASETETLESTTQETESKVVSKRPSKLPPDAPEGWDTFAEYRQWIEDYAFELADKDVEYLRRFYRSIEILIHQLQMLFEDISAGVDAVLAPTERRTNLRLVSNFPKEGEKL